MTWTLLAACTVPNAPPEPGEPLGPVLVAEGIQIGEEGDVLPCEDVEHPIGDPSIPAGILDLSADDFVAALPLEGLTGTLTLTDGSQLPFVATLTVDSEVRYVDQIATVAGFVCDQAWYRVDLIVAPSAPPALDERLRVWGESRGPSWRGALRLADVRGALLPIELDVDAWDEVFLDLPATTQGGPWSGTVIWRGRTGEEWGKEIAASWVSAARR